jgi:hypothetical protein
MHATARSLRPPPLPATPPGPRLRAVPPPRRRTRAPRAAGVAVYSLGLTAGFLLAALASAPGGAGIVAVQGLLALGTATIAGLALLRARAVARDRPSPRAPAPL